jgi:hypothetical protein
MEDLVAKGCSEKLASFIKMRLESQFFTDEYKNQLADLIISATENKDWGAVQKFMWPMLGDK